jgi:uncharacterized membrane protein
MEEDKQETPVSQTPEEKKMDEGRVMGVLSYLSVLCLIPLLFTKKDNDFVYSHAKQGLVLFCLESMVYVISRIVAGIGIQISFNVGGGTISILSLIFNLINIGLLVLSILGIINVMQNKKKELPWIGKFARNLKF